MAKVKLTHVMLTEILYRLQVMDKRLQDIDGRLVRARDVATHRARIEMTAIDDLTTKVKANADAEASAVTLLQGLKASLDAAIAAGDPVQIQALSDQLGAQTDALAAAVVANTPAA